MKQPDIVIKWTSKNKLNWVNRILGGKQEWIMKLLKALQPASLNSISGKINSFIKLNDGADFTPTTTFIIYEISNYKTLITVFDKKLVFHIGCTLGIFIMHLVLLLLSSYKQTVCIYLFILLYYSVMV